MSKKAQSTEQFISKLRLKFDDTELIDEYVDGQTAVSFRCRNCGEIWEMAPSRMLEKRQLEDAKRVGCPNCRKENVTQRSSKREKQFIMKLAEANTSIEYVSGYIKGSEKATFRCRNCGHVWEALPKNILKGSGCPVESRNNSPQCNPCTQSDFEAKVHAKYPDYVIVSQYTGRKNKITCRCGRGHEMTVLAGSLLSGRVGCRTCRAIENHENQLEKKNENDDVK